MRVLICVAEDARKKVPSSKGMKRSVETSQLINLRASTCVPERVKQMEEAIKECDFQSFAELTMKDSNQFHAICLDTFPPCTYMNGTSHAIVDLIHQVNDLMGKHMVSEALSI